MCKGCFLLEFGFTTCAIIYLFLAKMGIYIHYFHIQLYTLMDDLAFWMSASVDHTRDRVLMIRLAGWRSGIALGS